MERPLTAEGGGLMSGSRYQTSPSRNEGTTLLYMTNIVYGLQIPSPNKHSLENSHFRGVS